MHGTKASRGLVVAAALMFSALGSSLAMADPEPAPPAPTAEAPTSEAPAPTAEAPTTVAPTTVAPIPASSSSGSACTVIRSNKTQIDDTTWPLKVATKSDGWEWTDGDVREARSRVDSGLPPLLANLQQGLGGGEASDALRDAIAAGKDLISTIDHNGDGGDTSGALGAFDKALDDSLRACIDQ
ncbi:MAG: hypothetical protein ACRC20_02370 [Segniliparus sp.]|uniref:hypothetical protein n=1 Tax=Segniliparus sp. TaxID=2804064 RepID=UPI003F39B740